MFSLASLSITILAYCLGSISTAIITCRLLGLPDPREHGSGNPGATNVMRIGGKKAAAITLAGDFLKGLLPALLAQALGLGLPALAMVAFAAVAGHIFPVFFRFKGGKGVATAFGAICGIHPLLAAGWGLIWLAVFALSRLSSLSALTAFGALPLLSWLITADSTLTLSACAIMLMIIVRHKDNIKRLLSHEEGKL